jgi:hypothetical protein
VSGAHVLKLVARLLRTSSTRCPNRSSTGEFWLSVCNAKCLICFNDTICLSSINRICFNNRREAWIYHLPGAFSARHRQPLGIKQSDF